MYTVKRLTSEGQLPTSRVGDRSRVSVGMLEDWIRCRRRRSTSRKGERMTTVQEQAAVMLAEGRHTDTLIAKKASVRGRR